MKGQRGNPGLKGRLVDKSIEAYILALETINRLSIKYRLEAFCYLLCNAWELLLKAKILEDTGTLSAIYYKKKRGLPKRSLSLRDCLEKIIPERENPERRNIECIADLRDETVQLVFSQIPREVLCLFKAHSIQKLLKSFEWWRKYKHTPNPLSNVVTTNFSWITSIQMIVSTLMPEIRFAKCLFTETIYLKKTSRSV